MHPATGDIHLKQCQGLLPAQQGRQLHLLVGTEQDMITLGQISFFVLIDRARGDPRTMLSESRKTAEEGPVSVSVSSLAMERITPNAGWSSSG